jgi:cytochrome b subunit of formate dehydrogenase/nitrate/TMAO reductase-like tetraheme cytochrome c subunit
MKPVIFYFLLIFAGFSTASSAGENSQSCLDCHAIGERHAAIISVETINKSVHEGADCIDCHEEVSFEEHEEKPPLVNCGSCHEDEAPAFKQHGVPEIASTQYMPSCTSCHGSHDILSSDNPEAKTHPIRLANTCGACHEDPEVVDNHPFLPHHPVLSYQSSVHQKTLTGADEKRVSCVSCHGLDGSAHQILPAGNLRSGTNHFAISDTCGACHQTIKSDYLQGIHGQLMQRGKTDAPTCTGCHGEHLILSPEDDRSSVSTELLAETSCLPCHQNTKFSEQDMLKGNRSKTYIDPYHGLKSKSGEEAVANCSSCHGPHMILPQSDPRSSVHPDNVKKTCIQCHPDISDALAKTPVHSPDQIGEKGWPLVFRTIYFVIIAITILGMAVYILLDLWRQIKNTTEKGQIRRMSKWEILQHTLLLSTFVILVLTGFALRFSEAWWADLLFGKTGTFAIRSLIHKTAGTILILSTLMHIFYLRSKRGKEFMDLVQPRCRDLKQLWEMLIYNAGLSSTKPKLGTFSYVEKFEYWALVWGIIIMSVTGVMLWSDNTLVHYLPKTVLDSVQVIHYYEAWLATISIVIWHLYATIFNPEVYPMNLSWLTGKTGEKKS